MKRLLELNWSLAVLAGCILSLGSLSPSSLWLNSIALGQDQDATSTAKLKPAENATGEVAEEKAERPHIEIAIVLDTSGSMSGLINQARTQIWKIVNEFAIAERDGQQPDLKVALYEYGKSTLPSGEHWIRMIVPLTDDLDKVSEELFALSTNGGEEYCGAAIQRAVEELGWSKSDRDLKCIFIAGNEEFTQGPIDYEKSCAAAAGAGITVSTIHCGNHEQGVRTMWARGAKLADGSYMSIDQNAVIPDIPAPQDEQLVKLNAEFNKTYVAFGNKKERTEASQRQAAQDSNALKSSWAGNASRIQFKSGNLYDNAHWDLCDAYTQGKVKIEDVKEADLPENLKKMKPDERKNYIEKMISKRKQLQAQIKNVSDARGKYIADERKKLATSSGNTLDKAIIDAVRKQATASGFEFKK